MGATIGGVSLSKVQSNRLSFGLYGPSGRGKTLGAASFGGGEFGKIIVLNVEVGPEEGPGGLCSLLHAQGIHDRLVPEDVLVLNITSWKDMQDQYAWLRANQGDLVTEGYKILILDGGTAMSYLIRQAIVSMIPVYDPSPKRHNIMGQLVTTLSGEATSAMELYQYNIIYDRYIEMHSLLKHLPFTFISTFLEAEAYDEEKRKVVIGVGPKLIGRQLPAQIIAEVDGFFHCETTNDTYQWLTTNNPQEIGNPNPAVAKRRFGLKLSQYEPADGAQLLQKIGCVP
jgi:hypothetical protein